MVHAIRIIVTMVQVGARLWVNPVQVLAVYPCDMGPAPKTCVKVGSNEWPLESDWPVDRVLRALDGAGR